MDNVHSFENAESPVAPQGSAAAHLYEIQREAGNTTNLLILFQRSRAAMDVLYDSACIRGDLTR